MKIAIIDLDSVAFYIGYPNKVLDSEGNPIKQDGKYVLIDKTEDELKNSCHYWMNEILTKSEATHYIAYIKGKNTIKARLEVASTYKSNRNKEQPKWWSFVKSTLISEFGAIEVNDMEVDDAVNITKLNLKDSFICALDKDLLSTEGTHYNWSKNEWVTTTQLEAHVKFWTDMIAGQSGDGVKGIPGQGVKAAEKLFSVPEANLPQLTLGAYIKHFGEHVGIEEFYKNYKCLYILREQEGFQIPDPTEVKKKEYYE